MTSPNFTEDWQTLGVRTRKPRRKAESPVTSEATLREWLSNPTSTWLTVTGPTPQSRAAIYQKIAGDPYPLNVEKTRAWHHTDVKQVFVDFVAHLEVQHLDGFYPVNAQYAISGVPWGWLYTLCVVPDLYLDEYLQKMASRGTSLFFDTILFLFEIRFRIQEGAPAEEVDTLMQTFVAWLTNSPLTEEQTRLTATIHHHVGGIRTQFDNLSVLLFLLTVANQNNILQNNILVFDDLDTMLDRANRAALKGLQGLLCGFMRWTCVGPLPFLVLVGMDRTRMSDLKKLNTSLAKEVLANMAAV